MQSTKKLTAVLRDLVALLDDEAARNPEFAARLDAVIAALPSRGKYPRLLKSPKTAIASPDVFAALQEKGESEFRFWVRALDLPTLKTIIKVNGFDPAKVSRRWTDPDKFVGLVADQTIARRKRGSAFLSPRSAPPTRAEREKVFTGAMLEIYRRALTEANYRASIFFNMVNDQGGYQTAMTLIHAPKPSEGYTALWERRRLDLTVEAVVLHHEWDDIFTDEDRRAAYDRLRKYEYVVPQNSWHPIDAS